MQTGGFCVAWAVEYRSVATRNQTSAHQSLAAWDHWAERGYDWYAGH